MRRALWLGALLLLLLSLLPYGLRLGLVKWMMASGSRMVVVGKVDFDPFIGRVELSDLYGEGERGSLRCSQVVILFDLLPLWQRQIRIRSVELRGGSLDLDRHPVGGWAFGGLLFPAIREAEEEESANSWQWAVGKLVLNEIAIHYRDPVGSVGVSIDQARLENLDSRVPGAGSPFALRLLSGGGVVSMEGALSPLSPSESTRFDFTVKRLPLDRAVPLLKPYGIESLAGEMQGNGSVESGSDPGDLQLSIAGQLQVEGLRGGWTEGKLGSEQVVWQGEVRMGPHNDTGSWEVSGNLSGDLDLQMNDLLMHADRAELEGASTDGSAIFEGNAAAQRLRIQDLKRDRVLLLLEEVSLQDMLVGWEGKVGTEELHLAGLKALEWQRKGEKNPFLILVERGKLIGPQLLSPRRLDLGRVLLEGLEWRLEKDATGSLLAPRRFFDGGEEEDGKGAEPPPFTVRSSVADVKKGLLVFRDRSITPAYKETLHLEKLRLEGVDTSNTEKETRVRLDGGIGAYSSVHMEGVVVPMADRLNMSLDGRIKDLDLPSLSPYAERYLDYRLNSGHLNAEFSWRVKEGQLDSEARLRLVKLAVEPMKEKNGSRLSGILGMPVKKAISMLRDKEDTIRLRLPIEGDVRDPQFNWNSLITKATRAAVREAAVSYYAPLGVTLLTGAVLPPGSLFLGGKVVEWVRTMRFKPVTFLPLKELPEDDGEDYLREAARLLEGKPKARLVLCGLATGADLETLRRRDGREPLKSEPLLEEEREFLLDLARERALSVKESLLSLGIEAGRLLVCIPRIELKKDGRPRVEISI